MTVSFCGSVLSIAVIIIQLTYARMQAFFYLLFNDLISITITPTVCYLLITATVSGLIFSVEQIPFCDTACEMEFSSSCKMK